MYLGQRDHLQPLYRDVWHGGLLGWLPSRTGVQTHTLHQYQCERCGHLHRLRDVAAEPFYCAGASCTHLVGVQAHGEEAP